MWLFARKDRVGGEGTIGYLFVRGVSKMIIPLIGEKF
jgi:hypothetical protein